MAILNTRILKHPINYVTVPVIAFGMGLLGHMILTLAGLTPAGNGDAQKKTSAWLEMPAGQAPGEQRAGAIDPQSASLASNATYY